MDHDSALRATLRSRRRPRWLNAIAFLATFVILNVIVSAIEPWCLHEVLSANPGTLARTELYLEGKRADVLFMGSSRAVFGFDPAVAEQEVRRSTGVSIRALNIGNFGTDIDVSYLTLKNFIPDDGRPRVIVYGLSEYELNSNEEALTPILPYFSRVLQVNDFNDVANDPGTKIDFVVSQLLPLYRDRELLRDALAAVVTGNGVGPTRGHQVSENGYLPPSEHARAPYPNWLAAQRSLFRPLPGFRFTGPRLDRMRQFLDLARSSGISVVLVDMPSTALHRLGWGRDDLVRYLGLVRSLARQYDVPLLDVYEDSYDFPGRDFVDSQHLSQAGADVLTRLVAREILVDMFRASH